MKSAWPTPMMPSKVIFSLFLTAFLLFVTVPNIALADNTYWWDHHWAKRQLIGSTGTNSAYTTSHYLYITIDTSNSSNFQTDCDDLRIVYQSATAQTEIGRYVSGCTQTGTKVYFQAQASINANTDIDTLSSVYYVYYANSAASATSTTYTNTNFPQAPYTDDANAVALYHMENETSCGTNNVCDEGGSAYDFDLDTGSETWASGRVGYQALDCVDNQYDTDNDDGGAGTGDVTYDNLAITTVDVWVHMDASGGSGLQDRFMGSGDGWEIRVKSGNNFVTFDLHKTSTNTTVVIATCNVTSGWNHLRMVVNDTADTWQGYCNGAADPSTPPASFTFTGVTYNTRMALCFSTGSLAADQDWNGQLDELRISNNDRGAPDWVATEISTSLNTAESARTRRIHLMQ